MTERWRLLGPLEAVNGILMFGVSTAVITAAVLDVVKRRTEDLHGQLNDTWSQAVPLPRAEPSTRIARPERTDRVRRT